MPLLKTGAVAQYPVTTRVRHRTETRQYLDGSEQRHREFRAPLREWAIRLDLLDEAEMAALAEFFASYSSFSFVDPHTQAQYPDCSVADEDVAFDLMGEMRGRATLTIRENRT
ncbi:MAG: hypothetical protein HYR60_32390 [Acidobacteria bacterium]|nr:hypothetical protein [Acidobacteriota bacterium]